MAFTRSVSAAALPLLVRSSSAMAEHNCASTTGPAMWKAGAVRALSPQRDRRTLVPSG
jgi:hypothetical protein